MSDKVDLKRELDSYRARRGEFRWIDVPPRRYLMVDGQGDPNTVPAYPRALATLYPMAYALKFASRRELGRDYVVPPLEGLWWAEDWTAFTTERDKSAWSWTMLLLIPEWIPDPLIAQAARAARPKLPDGGAELLRWAELDEGRCVQTLHVGSFDDEAPVLARLHDEVIPGAGMVMRGHHHEIYLSDARRVAPERMRTILRQPVGPARVG